MEGRRHASRGDIEGIITSGLVLRLCVSSSVTRGWLVEHGK